MYAARSFQQMQHFGCRYIPRDGCVEMFTHIVLVGDRGIIPAGQLQHHFLQRGVFENKFTILPSRYRFPVCSRLYDIPPPSTCACSPGFMVTSSFTRTEPSSRVMLTDGSSL